MDLKDIFNQKEGKDTVRLNLAQQNNEIDKYRTVSETFSSSFSNFQNYAHKTIFTPDFDHASS